MYLPDIEVHEAATLEDAASLLERFKTDVRLLAGGTDVLVDLKTGRFEVHHLVDIGGLDGLRSLEVKSDRLRIGALTKISHLIDAPQLAGDFEVIREAASRLAAPQVRNAATVGGNIAGAVPCADLPPVLLVLDAEIEVFSPNGGRTVPLADFVIGPRQTILESGEIMTSVLVPRPVEGFGAAYERFSLRDGNAIAVASVAAGLLLDEDGTVVDVNVALGSVAPTPKLVASIGESLGGQPLDDDTLDRASAMAIESAEPITDVRGTAEFRRDLVGILTRRALLEAARRSKGSIS